MYYVRLCSKKLLSDIARARTLFVLLPRSSPVFLPPPYYSNSASSFFLFKELYQSHFAPGLCFSSRWQLFATLRANSKRYRLPLFLSLSSALSCPETSLFLLARYPFKGGKEWSRCRVSIVHLTWRSHFCSSIRERKNLHGNSHRMNRFWFLLRIFALFK